MKQYHDLLIDIKENGVQKQDRTGTGTLSVFGRQMRFDLSKGFPLVTTKRVYWKAVIHELLWFLSGDTNIKYLNDNNVHIWDEWADEEGDLGPIYGSQWRSWGFKGFDDSWTTDMGLNQLHNLIEGLANDPDSRRHILSAWNVEDLSSMALPPCHVMSQFYVANGKLSCQLLARSQDTLLGTPFNIASYSLLTHMIAKQVGLEVGDFIHTIGDAHIYLNHLEQVDLQLTREPRPLPKLTIKEPLSILLGKDYPLDNIVLEGYDPYPAIKAPIAV